MLRPDLSQKHGRATLRILLYRELKMLQLQGQQSTQSIHREYAKHAEKTHLDTLVSEIEPPFLCSENGLVQFGQVLDVDWFFASLLVI